MPCGIEYRTISQPSRTRVRRARSPKTSREAGRGPGQRRAQPGRGPGGGRPGLGAEADEQGRDRERHRVDEQRRPDAEEGHRGASGGRARHLGGQVGRLDDRRAEGVALARQDARGHRGPGRLRRRREHGGREQQAHHGGDGHGRHGHGGDEESARHITGHHHGAARTAVSQVGQEQAADHPGQVAGGIRQRRQQRRPGALVDQHGQGDEGQPVSRRGQQDREPQRAELAYREDGAERGPRRRGGRPAGRLPCRAEAPEACFSLPVCRS